MAKCHLCKQMTRGTTDEDGISNLQHTYQTLTYLWRTFVNKVFHKLSKIKYHCTKNYKIANCHMINCTTKLTMISKVTMKTAMSMNDVMNSI